MKNIQSTIEGTWYELVNVTLTQSEQTLLASTDPNDLQAQQTLRQDLISRSRQSLTSSEVQTAQSIYDQHKPALEEEDTYQLISADMVLGGDNNGIINCRINGEHKQIRF